MQTAEQDKIRKQCIELGTRQVDCGQPYTEAEGSSEPARSTGRLDDGGSGDR
jgi:hypothetical protein